MPKKMIAVLFAILFFAGMVYGLETITIGNTDLTLLSNTEQCLVNCEAWIEWDLSGSTGFSISQGPSSLFKMDFEKKAIENKSLVDYGIEVWENVEKTVTDYCGVPGTYLYTEDLNASFPTCASVGCKDKGQNCECDAILSKACGSHKIYNWEKVGNFYGFSFKAGSIYRLKIWGKRKPSLESGGIDWIPTFFGQKLRQWAWWNTDWDYKTNFTITANQDLNAGYSLDLNVQMLDFTSKFDAGKMRSDYGDIRVIYNDADEMLFHFEDDNSNDFNRLWITSPIGLSATDTISFDAYYGNAAAEYVGADLNSPAMDNNIYAYFRLEDNAANTIVYDYSGNNRDANSSINTSGMTFEGKYKQALGDFADDSTNINMRGNLDGMTQGTIDFFMNRESGDGGQHIFGYYTAAPIEGIDIAVDTQGDVIWQNVVGGSVKWEIGNNLATTPIGEWTHIMVTWGPTGAQICVNGQVKAVNAATDALATVVAPLLIGARNYEGSLVQEFDGQLDEFRIRDVQIDCNTIYQYYPEVNLEGVATVTNVAAEEAAPTPTAITDLNLFGYNFFEDVDLNIDSDINVLFDINITGEDLNYDSILVYYHSIETGDSNRYGFIRTDPQLGWKIETTDDISWTVLLTDGDTNHVRSSAEDDHAYKQWSYNLDPEEFEVKDGAIELNGGVDWLSVLITNVITDVNTFYNFSFSGRYEGIGSEDLTVYDCNNQAASPSTDIGCNIFDIAGTDLVEADGYYSIKLTSNDQNQLVGDKNVNMNPDGNHWFFFNCASCTPSKTWNIDYISETSNIDRTRNWSSTTGVGNLTALANSIDLHIHWTRLSFSNFFDWIVQISKNDSGGDTNSIVRRHLILPFNIAPTVGDFNAPQTLAYHNGTIDINVGVFDSFRGVLEDGLVCDINILDNGFMPVDQVSFGLAAITRNSNGGFHCAATYNTALRSDGNYFLTARVRETTTIEVFSDDRNTSVPFFIDNTAPTIVGVFPVDAEDTDSALFTFSAQIQDVGVGEEGCDYGIFLNGIIDVNGSVDVNASGYCVISYLFTDFDDEAIMVINLTEDILGNEGEVAEASATITYVRPFGLADPEDITEEDYSLVGLFSIYNLMVAAAGLLPFFFVFVVVIILFVVLKR